MAFISETKPNCIENSNQHTILCIRDILKTRSDNMSRGATGVLTQSGTKVIF